MSLEETKVIDQITVTENGIIHYREVTKILKDSVVIAETYHRNTLFPGNDLSDVPSNVVAIANVVWTAEVVSNYQANLLASSNTSI